jgi:hypothetical protein
MSNCISHAGLYDDWDNPLTDEGELYLPGRRFCKHRDCVNLGHIEGYATEESFIQRVPVRAARDDQQVIRLKVIELGNLPRIDKKSSACQLPGCDRVLKARNLCQNHWQMFSRHSDVKLRHCRDTYDPADFVHVPAPNWSWSNKPSGNCTYEGCLQPQYTRTMCKNHSRVYRRFAKQGLLATKKATFVLADFAHVPSALERRTPNGLCSMPDCESKQYSRTLCQNHYRRLVRLEKEVPNAA